MSSRINLANVILTPREWCVQKTTFKVYSRTRIFLLLDSIIVLLCEFSYISWSLAVFFIISEFYQMRKETLYFSMCLLGEKGSDRTNFLYRE